MVHNIPKKDVKWFLTEDGLRISSCKRQTLDSYHSIDISDSNDLFSLKIRDKANLLKLKEIIDFALEDKEELETREDQIKRMDQRQKIERK